MLDQKFMFCDFDRCMRFKQKKSKGFCNILIWIHNSIHLLAVCNMWTRGRTNIQLLSSFECIRNTVDKYFIQNHVSTDLLLYVVVICSQILILSISLSLVPNRNLDWKWSDSKIDLHDKFFEDLKFLGAMQLHVAKIKILELSYRGNLFFLSCVSKMNIW